MDGLASFKAIAIEKPKREPKRIYIRFSKNVRNAVNKAKDEAKFAKKVLGWPSTVTCQICYKKDVPVDDAILRLGINSERGNYWMCRKHL